jgi:hypothetical protein
MHPVGSYCKEISDCCFCFCALFYDFVSNCCCVACECKMNDTVEGMCRDSAVALLKVLSMHLRGRTEEILGKPQS